MRLHRFGLMWTCLCALNDGCACCSHSRPRRMLVVSKCVVCRIVIDVLLYIMIRCICADSFHELRAYVYEYEIYLNIYL